MEAPAPSRSRQTWGSAVVVAATPKVTGARDRRVEGDVGRIIGREEERVDITQLILDDHQEQRRLFAIIEQMHAEETTTLASVWRRLSNFLEVHAKAEEEYFYPELLRSGDGAGGKPTPSAETKDAIEDHNEIRDAIAKVAKHPVGSDAWFAAVADANEANSDHMGEEERQGLTDFRQNVSLETRHALAVRFIAFEAGRSEGVVPENVRPSEYIREHSA